ncbi:MAG: mannose-1-phosphate guanylyltransferase [Woeseia sp.]|nr:mannose-1-phosphate guanylyltransferase [Woeseia sp.]
MVAMILAAGRGKRLRPITDRSPKALVEIGGEKLIDRHLRMLASAGIETVVINLGWLGEKIVEHVGSGSRFGLQIVYSPEYQQILETGGGIRRALPILGRDTFWTINADVVTDFVLPVDAISEDAQAELVLVATPEYKDKGDFDLVDGKVRNGLKPLYTYGGIARYRPEFFSKTEQEKFSVVPLLREAAERGELAGSIYSGVWHDVGTPERLEQLNRR